MARDRQLIEARFRSGSRWFIWIAALSAVASTAAYKGLALKFLGTFSLATPLVAEAVVRKFGGNWLWAEQAYYYSWIFGLALAAIFALIGVISSYASHTGAFLKLDKIFGVFARVGSAMGLAHLVGSRLLYFSGMVIYVLDGLLAFGMEVLLRGYISDLRILVLMNLAFHFAVLCMLCHGFVAGLERERKPVEE